MTYDEAIARLVALARENGGVLTAAAAEGDPGLAAADHNLVSAAARSLDGTTNVFGSPRTGDGWFPFDELHFTALARTASG